MSTEKTLAWTGLVITVPSCIALLIPFGIQYSTPALWLMPIGLAAGVLILLSALIVRLTRPK